MTPSATLSLGLVLLGVEDLARSIRYYRDHLGLPLQSQFEGFAYFAAGPVLLCLRAPFEGAAAGGAEYVFPVPSVTAAHADLAARGVEFDTEPHAILGAQWTAHFRDPDGHRFALFGPE